MQTRFAVAAVVKVVIAVAVLAYVLPQPTAEGQPAEYRVERTADGSPDLSGIWQALGTAHYDLEAHAAKPALQLMPARPRAARPGIDRATAIELPAPAVRALGAVGGVPAGESVVVGGAIPYQPWALQRRNENAANWIDRDPEIKCFLPGVPRATYMPYPFQILQGTTEILFAHEYSGTTRTIHMREVADSPNTTWMGWSRGRWDGDTLVVETNALNGESWFDRAGNFHSDALKVVERFTRTTPYHLTYEATMEDPNVFTRPWTISMPLYKIIEPNKRLLEYKCVEFVEQLMYGPIGIVDPSTGNKNE